MTFDQIEHVFNQRGKELINYFNEHPETNLSPFTRSETGINKKQFTQFASFVGLKPSMSGKVIPLCIKDNFLHGLSNYEYYYINCLGTRLALTTNYGKIWFIIK